MYIGQSTKTDVRRRGAICITINDFEEGIDEQRYRSNFYSENSDNDNYYAHPANKACNNNYKKASKNFQCCHNLFGKRRKNKKLNRNYNNFESSGEG